MKSSKKAFMVSGKEVLEAVVQNADGRVHVSFDGEVLETATRSRGGRSVLQTRDGNWVRAEVTPTRDGAWVSLDGETIFVPLLDRKPRGGAALSGQGPVSPMPGVVVRVDVVEGQTVQEGDVLAVVEAMKMEHSVRAGNPGTVTKVLVSAGDRVEGGALLAEVSSEEDEG